MTHNLLFILIFFSKLYDWVYSPKQNLVTTLNDWREWVTDKKNHRGASPLKCMSNPLPELGFPNIVWSRLDSQRNRNLKPSSLKHCWKIGNLWDFVWSEDVTILQIRRRERKRREMERKREIGREREEPNHFLLK